MIAYQIKEGTIANVIIIADDADPAEFDAVGGDGIPEGAGIGWRLIGGNWVAPERPAASFDKLRASKVADIEARASACLAIGAPVPGDLHVAVDDGSRADLAAMATTATAATAGAVSWPESYARGWISIENVRIPLSTPAAGLALAASVGDWYARVVQHRRDLKDQVLAAADLAALDAIDINSGWPG